MKAAESAAHFLRDWLVPPLRWGEFWEWTLRIS
jgi:hypothetical protein